MLSGLISAVSKKKQPEASPSAAIAAVPADQLALAPMEPGSLGELSPAPADVLPALTAPAGRL